MNNNVKIARKLGAAFLVVLLSGGATMLILKATDSRVSTTQPAADKIDSSSPVASSDRNATLQPFSERSIWNMPIGSDARYADAKLSSTPGSVSWAQIPYGDEIHIIFRPNAPMTNIFYSDAGWTGKSRCAQSSDAVVDTVPLPEDYSLDNNTDNSIAVFLMPDKRTIKQLQPFARCGTMPPTAMVPFQQTDLYGDGRVGAHGGSNLSGLGGTLRIGELRPGGNGPRHALKLNVYTKESMVPCQKKEDCYQWPASTADNYAVGHYGADARGNLKMGTLLAIPKTTNISSLKLSTEPAKQLAWTLQNYGAYIVDDTYSPALGISVEQGPDGSFKEQFRRDYNLSFDQRLDRPTDWSRDIQTIMKALNMVTNSSESTVGGGGTPLQPLAPKLAD